MKNNNQFFNQSQKCHLRLIKKYKNSRKDSDWIKYQYHVIVFDKQRKLKRVLSDFEKQKEYDYCVRAFNS